MDDVVPVPDQQTEWHDLTNSIVRARRLQRQCLESSIRLVHFKRTDVAEECYSLDMICMNPSRECSFVIGVEASALVSFEKMWQNTVAVE